uniref:NADH dehydrogenase subunit 6 n=1 Tax=Ixodes loricatus TaxID=59649 RepID=UPI00286D50ED|nr:NADH dehydrogenase subunit 6 [Ixodes loricatus]WKW95222.1 NADH dehydrogenase subunit 6 [Ixodes loricatus]
MKPMILFSVMFFMFNHPMFMLIVIIMTTLVMSVMIFNLTKISWISLILILLVLGGMLILFLYMISLIPNKKMTLNKKFIFLLLASMISFQYIPYSEVYFPLAKSLFFYSSMNFIMFMMIYLLITLMIVMNIMSSSKAPMKLFN